MAPESGRASCAGDSGLLRINRGWRAMWTTAKLFSTQKFARFDMVFTRFGRQNTMDFIRFSWFLHGFCMILLGQGLWRSCRRSSTEPWMMASP